MTKLRIAVRPHEDRRVFPADPEKSLSCSCLNNTQCFVTLQRAYARKGPPSCENDPMVNRRRSLFLEFEESELLWYSALGYLVPVLALCSGAVLGGAIDRALNFENSELFSIISGLSGFALSFQIKHWVINQFPRRFRKRPALSS